MKLFIGVYKLTIKSTFSWLNRPWPLDIKFLSHKIVGMWNFIYLHIALIFVL